MIGDIGGVYQLGRSFLGIVFFSVSKFSFTLSVIKQLFLIQTKESTLFKPKNQKLLNENSNAKIKGV
jgi:hypothetical protein